MVTIIRKTENKYRIKVFFKLKFLIYTNFIHISIIIIIKFSVLNWLDLYVRMKKYYKLIFIMERCPSGRRSTPGTRV